ncbi:MAG: tetraacyldisaccharide 4'-kinase [Vicinamibacterales bacterium]
MYAAAAGYRRRHYESRPDLRRRLRRPVISLGNIAAGGRAKTPLVGYIAARLLAFGERPAILSRGYGRRDADDGVVVVRDQAGIRADLDRSGDEPLMLARHLDGVTILASPDRYLAGCLAERRFDCTVHVLDDGFQHFQLERTADLVAVAPQDLRDARTLPGGRLREPLDALGAADAIIALEDADVGSLAGHRPVWRMRRVPGRRRAADAFFASGGTAADLDAGLDRRDADRTAVVAVAGIAHPESFFRTVDALGIPIVRKMPFRDHHIYSRHDVRTIFAAAAASGAGVVLTTEKDLVRLLPYRPFPMRLEYVPMTVAIDDAQGLDGWLRGVLAEARA